MKLFIKFMVSHRCKLAVKLELDKLGLHSLYINLGVVDIIEEIDCGTKDVLKKNLKEQGLTLLDDNKEIIINNIKCTIIEMIRYSDELPELNYSNYISNKLGLDYTYLANIFSETQKITIQQYIILNKIEFVKELILYGEMNLTEISYALHYSSVAHLCNQFKKVTGITTSYFKKQNNNLDSRKEIDFL